MPYETKTADQIKGGIILNLVENTVEFTDVNVGSGVDLIAAGFSLELEEQYQDLDLIYEGTRISTATGVDLEELGALVGVNRNQGVQASGTVTFSRNEPATANFIIPEGSIVSTQPNTETTQLQYDVTADTTFPTSITDEQHTFRNGVYRYKLDQRFVDSISTLDGTSGSSPTTFTQNTDFSIVEDFSGKLLVLDNFEVVEDCETAGDWTEGDEADAPTNNATEFYEGSNSINMLKSGTSTTKLSYVQTLPSVFDITDEHLYMRLFIKDSAALAKVSQVTVHSGNSGALLNSYNVVVDASDLSVGWNRIKLDPDDANINVVGNPNDSTMNRLKIEVDTVNTTDTFAAGDLLMDMWFLADEEDFDGDIVFWDKDQTIPDDNTIYEVDYVPLSVEVPVLAQAVGAAYNASKGKVVFKVTSLTSIDRIFNYTSLSGGIDVETDDDYRVRIQNATLLNTNATVEAIRFNVLDLDFVSSVTVNDTPQKTATDEVHTYQTGTDIYALDQQVPIDNATLSIGDSPGMTDYTKGVDYVLTADGEIDWSVGGTSPADDAEYYVTYDYNRLGHFEVFVVGAAGPLTSDQLDDVDEVVQDTKAAGVFATVLEPTFIPVNVEVTPTIDPSFTATTVKDNVDLAIQAYFDTLGVDDDVILAAIIQACMDVSGVTNVTVVDIGGGGASDFVIASDEVAQAGTITVN